MVRNTLLMAALAAGLAVPLSAAAAATQANMSTEGAVRAGSNAGSSAMTPTHAPAPKKAKPMKSSSSSHRLPANTTGMGSQAANTTGSTSNSH